MSRRRRTGEANGHAFAPFFPGYFHEIGFSHPIRNISDEGWGMRDEFFEGTLLLGIFKVAHIS